MDVRDCFSSPVVSLGSVGVIESEGGSRERTSLAESELPGCRVSRGDDCLEKSVELPRALSSCVPSSLKAKLRWLFGISKEGARRVASALEGMNWGKDRTMQGHLS